MKKHLLTIILVFAVFLAPLILRATTANDPAAISSSYYEGGNDSLTTNALDTLPPSPDYYLSVSPTSLKFVFSASLGMSQTFAITSNTNWTVSCDSCSWLVFSPASGSNNGTVKITPTDDNTASTPRTATITISATGVASQTVSVTQAGDSTRLTLSVSPNSLNFTASGGQQTFTITSNTDWTASSSASWLTVSQASGSNNGTINVIAATDTANIPRTATIAIIGSGIDRNGDGILDNQDAFIINVTQAVPQNALQTWHLSPTMTATLDSIGVLTVSTTKAEGEAMPDYDWNTTPWHAVLADIRSLEIKDKVTTIGDYAFFSCNGLTSVIIPNSVTSIGNQTFSYCSGLTSVIIPNSVTSTGTFAFSGCSSLTSVIIPNSITSIADGTFWQCYSLTSVIMPDSVTSIGSNAFEDCSGLTSMIIPNSVTSIGDYAFDGCTALTDVTVDWTTPLSVPADAFKNDNTSALTLHVPSGTKALYQADPVWRTFGAIVESCGQTWNLTPTMTATLDCDGILTVSTTQAAEAMPNYNTNYPWYPVRDSIRSVVIENNVTSTGNLAFYWCTNLTSVSMPTSVVSIGDMSFYTCTGLTSISIPNSVVSIENRAFYDCSGLTSVTIPNSVVSIGDESFTDCSSLTSVTIPVSVTSIGVNPFSWCNVLTSIEVDPENTAYLSDSEGVLYNKDKTILYAVPGSKTGTFTIPNSVVTIGNTAFGGCNVTSVIIPNSVKSIGNRAFAYTGLTSVNIPNSVISIGSSAFDTSIALTDVTVNWTTPLAVDSDAFSSFNASACTLHVPAGTVAAYQADPVWRTFGTIDDGSATINNVLADGNPDFEDWSDGLPIGWSYANGSGTYGNFAQETNADNVQHGSSSLSVTILQTVASLGSSWHIQLVSPSFTTVKGHTYSVSFYAKASIDSCMVQSEWDHTGSSSYTSNTLSTDWKSYTMSFSGSLPIGTGASTTIAFDLAYNPVGAVIYLDNINIVDTTDNGTTTPTLSVSPTSLNFAASDGQQTFTITSNTSWNVVSSDSLHFKVSPSSGSNNSTITVTSVANSDSIQRTAIIAVSGTGVTTQTISITQDVAKVPSVIPDEPQPVSADGKGTIGLSLSIPSNATLTGSFEISFPAGMTLNEDSTALVPELAVNFYLSFTNIGNNTWLIEINSNALRSSTVSASEYTKIMDIAYTVNESVSKGTYEATITNLDFVQDNGIPIKENLLTVPITVNQAVTSIENISNSSFYACFINNMLRIESAQTETITIYSTIGVQLYSVKKDAGMIEIPFPSIPGSVYIIKGSVSGTIKAVK